MATSKTPKLKDLHVDPATAFKNHEFLTLVNQPPHLEWLKNHPTAKTKNDKNENVPAKYMPIDKIEFLLDFIFQEWKIEVLNVSIILNSVCVTIRLHYKRPDTGEWFFHDGVGAKSVQLDSGVAASDLSKIKPEGVMMALPSAKSYAIKDAAEHVGTLFGRNLNRRNTVEYYGAYDPPVETGTNTRPAADMAGNPPQTAGNTRIRAPYVGAGDPGPDAAGPVENVTVATDLKSVTL